MSVGCHISWQCYRDTGTGLGMEWKPVVNQPSHVLSMLQGYRYWAGNGVEASCESALTCLVNVTGLQVLGREWSGSQLWISPHMSCQCYRVTGTGPGMEWKPVVNRPSHVLSMLQGYRYWAGNGVEASCESALTCLVNVTGIQVLGREWSGSQLGISPHMSCQCYRDTGTGPGMEWKPVVNRPSHVLSMLQGYRYWAGNGVEASCESALTCLVNVTGLQVLGREWSGSQLWIGPHLSCQCYRDTGTGPGMEWKPVVYQPSHVLSMLQGYRYWAGNGVEASCESALTCLVNVTGIQVLGREWSGSQLWIGPHLSCQCYRDTGTGPGMEWKPVVNRPSHVLSMLQGYRYWVGNGVEASCESALTCLVNVTGIQVDTGTGPGMGWKPVVNQPSHVLSMLQGYRWIQVLGREWSGSQLWISPHMSCQCYRDTGGYRYWAGNGVEASCESALTCLVNVTGIQVLGREWSGSQLWIGPHMSCQCYRDTGTGPGMEWKPVVNRP